MGGRLGALLGPLGLVIIGMLVLAAVLTLARRRMGGSGGSIDPMGIDGDGDAGRDRDGRPNVLPDFRTFLDCVAFPRREAHPYWERLDGAMGVPGKPIAWFERNGVVYGVNGETTFAALDAIDDWMRANPGEDPFEVVTGKGAKGRLAARPEVGWTDRKALRVETG